MKYNFTNLIKIKTCNYFLKRVSWNLKILISEKLITLLKIKPVKNVVST